MLRAFYRARTYRERQRRFKEMVAVYAHRQHGLTVAVDTHPMIYHQPLTWQGKPTMLVVPFPRSENYALNEKDYNLRGEEYEQVLFGRIRTVDIPEDKALLDLHLTFTLPQLAELLNNCKLMSGDRGNGPYWLVLTGMVEM
jgi:hypothetical protein